jgi:hypothetical protein
LPEARLGLTLPLMRDIVFGSLEHIVWTAMVQRREDAIDVPKMSRDLAAAYLRAFGIADEVADAPAPKPIRGRSKARKNRRSTGTRHASEPSSTCE